jgi:uncharacterized glyoxalase superfamily protein PhnB
VKDQDAALDYYTKTLGFEKKGDNPAPGGGRFLSVGVKGDDFQVVLWPGVPGRPMEGPGVKPAACIVFTDDCRRDFESFKGRGVKFEGAGVVQMPWGALVATIVDPDGNRLMFQEFPKEQAPA